MHIVQDIRVECPFSIQKLSVGLITRPAVLGRVLSFVCRDLRVRLPGTPAARPLGRDPADVDQGSTIASEDAPYADLVSTVISGAYPPSLGWLWSSVLSYSVLSISSWSRSPSARSRGLGWPALRQGEAESHRPAVDAVLLPLGSKLASETATASSIP